MNSCPVCGGPCIESASSLISVLSSRFSPCPRCKGIIKDKDSPVSINRWEEVCTCNKRFIDDVFAHIGSIMVEEGVISPIAPLKSIGTPLIHPGYSIKTHPFLPPRSLVFLSPHVDKKTAERLQNEVIEIKAVIKSSPFTPGLSTGSLKGPVRTYKTLSGCDVRADIFETPYGPIVLYKPQSLLHIEFPRGNDPKIANLAGTLSRKQPSTVLDACCGVGTLGITAALFGVKKVTFNDAWFASAYFSGLNLLVNSSALGLESVTFTRDWHQMKKHPVSRRPLCVAYCGEDRDFQVWQGDYHEIVAHLKGTPDLTIIDPFQKGSPGLVTHIKDEWRAISGGEAFIP